jgi:hypothetical protein
MDRQLGILRHTVPFISLVGFVPLSQLISFSPIPSCTPYFQVSTSTGNLKASQAKLQEDLSNKVSAHKYPRSFQRRLSQMILFRTLLWTLTTPATTFTTTATTSTCTASPSRPTDSYNFLMGSYHESVWLFQGA